MARILLVDDSVTDRTLLKGLLSKNADFQVRCAASGREALEVLADSDTELVVTDMQMPEMDGLELVTAVRARHPHIPVILITGQGSEALAAKALKRGAAGYVPKTQSHQLLCDTVQHVIDLSKAADDHERLLAASNHVHFDFEIANDPTLIAPLQDLAQRMAAAMGICDSTGCLQLGVALEHAVTNAIYHGNLELTPEMMERVRHAQGNVMSILGSRRAELPYADRSVDVSIDITRDEVQIVVSDDGHGFDVQEVTHVGLTRSLSGGSGQGLFLMWAFMDKVSFDRTGTKVTMIKRRQLSDPEGRSAENVTAASGQSSEPPGTEVDASGMTAAVPAALPASSAHLAVQQQQQQQTIASPAIASSASTAVLPAGQVDEPAAAEPKGAQRVVAEWEKFRPQSAKSVYGELVSREGGRVIPLTKTRLTVGRLESCDMVLNHPKISHHHCVLCLHEGWWFVKDLHSKNGTRVNHNPVMEHLLRPGNTLTLGSLEFEIRYSPHDLGAIGITPPPEPF